MKRAWSLYLLAGLMAVLAFGCVPPPTEPGDIVINNTNTATNNSGGNPTASPSPGAGGSVASVGIGKFGEACPAGVAPSGLGDSVRVNCTAFITCSPKSASGQEIFDLGIIGPAPESFVATEGNDQSVTVQVASNPYNLDVKGKAKGTAKFQCRVKAITSPTFTLNVIN